MALVAERTDPETGEREILGVSRLSQHGAAPGEAEFSILISDRFQRRGLGTLLLSRLLEVGRAEGLRRITAAILLDNRPCNASASASASTSAATQKTWS
jgi:acetyltransferase